MKNLAKKRLVITIFSFLLLIPFRLPVSVLLIKLFNNIAQIEGTQLSLEILRANVLCTKIIYNIFFSVILVYSIEKLSRELKGRKSKGRKSDMDLYWWSFCICTLLFIYNIFDGYWVMELFNLISK